MRFHFLSVACALVLFSLGCGGPTGPVGPQAQVSGTVTNDGKPVTLNSLVVFFNKDKGLTLTGTVDSLGKYSITAADAKVGVPVGRYEVSITPPVAAVVDLSPSSPDYQKMMQAGDVTKQAAGTDTAPDIPEKFRSASTSMLVFEVKQGANTYDFDLAKL